jgi:hypothetical protein
MKLMILYSLGNGRTTPNPVLSMGMEANTTPRSPWWDEERSARTFPYVNGGTRGEGCRARSSNG